MSLFDKLLVAHLVADILLQTEWQALNKGQNYRAFFSHIAIYSVIMMGILVVDFGFQNIYIYFVVGMLALSHGFLDRGWPVIRLMSSFHLIVERKPERWLVMAVDQTLHVLFLAFAAILLSI
ncbi:DUF3307 domain-containing protein [Chloroflexota bacterium]